MLITLIKYYLVIGFFDGLVIQLRFRQHIKYAFLAMLIWPYVLYLMFREQYKDARIKDRRVP